MTLEGNSSQLIINVVNELVNRKLVPTYIKCKIETIEDKYSYYQEYSNFQDLLDLLSLEIGNEPQECRIGDIITITRIKVRNDNTNFLNFFLGNNVINSLDVIKEEVYNNFTQTEVTQSVTRYQTLFENILNTYISNYNGIIFKDLEKIYVYPCYVDSGYVEEI